MPTLEIDKLTLLPMGQGTLKTKGVLMCVAVCIKGLIKDKPYFAMTHIMADPDEFDEAVNLFTTISQIYIIGGTDDWYGEALFKQIETRACLMFGKKLVISQFNPANIKSSMNKSRGADVSFDGVSINLVIDRNETTSAKNINTISPKLPTARASSHKQNRFFSGITNEKSVLGSDDNELINGNEQSNSQFHLSLVD